MSCKLITNGRESILHKKLIDKFKQPAADFKLSEFESAVFLEEFGDYLTLMENESDFIPESFKGRLNEYKEPELFDDNVGTYYIDKNYNKQYLDIKSSELYNIFKSQKAINTLTELTASNYINEGGFNLDFESLELNNSESELSLNESIKTYLESLGNELVLSENDTLFTNGVALLNILDNKEALIELENKIKDFFKSRKLEYNEDLNDEDLDLSEDEVRDVGFQKASVNVNTKSKVRAGVKLRLSLIKDPSKLDSDFAQAQPIDYNSLYNKLTALLKNNPVMFDENGDVIDQFESMIHELEKHSSNIKYLPILVDYLKNVNKLDLPISTNEGILLHNFKAGFVNAFNLQKNNLGTKQLITKEIVVSKAEYQDILDDDGSIKRKKKIKDEVKGLEYKYESFDATKETNVRKDIVNNWSLLLKDNFGLTEDVASVMTEENRKKWLDVKNKLESLKNNTQHSAKTKALNIKDRLLPSLGIVISDEAFNYSMNDFKTESEDYNQLNKNYNTFVENTFKLFENLISNHQNNISLFNNYSYNKIADAEAFYMEDGSESSIYTAGKAGKMTSKYMYSNPSNLHNQINAWKKDRNQLLREYENLNSWEKESQLYKYLLALDVNINQREKESVKRIEEFEIRHFNSFLDKSNPKAKQKDGSSVSEPEYVKDTVNGILASQSSNNALGAIRTTTAPGKATQYELVHKMFIDSKLTQINGQYITDIPRGILRDYLQAEFVRMDEQFKYLSSGEDLDVYYHTDKKGNTLKNGKLVGNAFKSQLFPGLDFNNFDKNIDLFYKDKQPILLYNENGSINLENLEIYEQKILDYIDKVIIEKVQQLEKDLLKYNVIEKSGQNTYTNKGIDTRVWLKYSQNPQTISSENLSRLLGDIFLNGLVNHIEYSKMFAGDVAYYKDPVDYIKRIGATYSDGIYEYLSEINKDFKVAVVDAVEYREPYLELLKPIIKGNEELLRSWNEEVNAADAQAWITPKRWKSILLGVSKFTPAYEIVYKKLTGKIKEPLTDIELKIVAQPLKGTYFGRTPKGKPVFLKYSQAVLIPQLVINTPLNDMIGLMNSNKIDELVTFDAIKAGSIQTTKIHTEEGKLNVKDADGNYLKLNKMVLNSKGWKLQQDLPTKTFKETDIGSQILKNMLLLISDKIKSTEKVFEYNNETYTAEEFAKLLDTTLGQLIEKGYQDLLKEFDIDPETGVINNFDKFYNTLADELVSRDVSDEVVKALRAGLSIYALPGLKDKLDNIFASIVNDRTVKIKTNGGSFIQMSNFGLSKEEADSKYDGIKWSPELDLGDTTKPYTYVLDENGEPKKNIFGEEIITPEQILISGSFIAKYIPDYQTKTSEELFGHTNDKGEFVPGLIDSKILENIIGYRIPNQGPSSNGALKIVGILPAGMGDTVVAFTGITKKTGSDFDIDKMYIMFPNYSPNFDKKSKLYKYVKNNLKGKTINDTIENVEKVINQINPNYEGEFNIEDFVNDIFSIENVDNTKDLQLDLLKDTYSDFVDVILSSKSKSPLYEYIVEEAGLKEIVNLRYVDSGGNSKKAIQNKVIELYKTLILQKDNIQKIMTPLDHPHIKQDAQNLAPAKVKGDLDNFEFVQDIQTKYSFLAGLAGVGQESNASSDYAMGTMSNVYYESVNVGKRSHQGESFYKDIYDQEGNWTKDIYEQLTKFDEINTVSISEKELKEWVDSYNKQAKRNGLEEISFEDVKHYTSFPISDNISALMNAFVDIAKDPYITNINWNMMTTNTGNMLLRAGVHPFIVTSFLAQPIIKEYIDFVSTYESNRKADQVSNTKDAFRVYKVGELIKDKTFIISQFESGENAEINYKTFYNIVAKNTFDLESLGEKSFSNTYVLKEIKSKLGLPESHQFTEKDLNNIKTISKEIIKQHYLFFKTKDFGDFRINDNLGKLRNNVFENNPSYQADIFVDFLTFQGFAKKVKASVDASKHSVNGMGKNTTSLLIAINKVKDIQDKGVIYYNTKMEYPDGTKKVLGYNYDNLLNTAKIVQANPLMFVGASQHVWNAFNSISVDIYGEYLQNDELGNKLDAFFKNYLMSGFDPLNISSKEKRDLIENLPKEFIEFKRKHSKEYKILEELKINTSQGKSFIGLTNKSNSKEFTDQMINSWREMMEFYPEFSKKLIQYSFITSGFNPTTTSFYQYIPPSFFFQNNFNGYVKKFNNKFTDKSIDLNFIEQFYLSNLKDSQIVKFVSSNKKMKDQPYLKGGVTLFSKDVTKKFINVSNVFYKRLGVNSKGENMYTEYLQTSEGFVKIKPLVSELDKNIKVFNINANELSLESDNKLSEEHKTFLKGVYNAFTYDTNKITVTEDEFGQEDNVKTSDLNNNMIETKQEVKFDENEKDYNESMTLGENLFNKYKDIILKNNPDTTLENIQGLVYELGEKEFEEYIKKCKE